MAVTKKTRAAKVAGPIGSLWDRAGSGMGEQRGGSDYGDRAEALALARTSLTVTATGPCDAGGNAGPGHVPARPALPSERRCPGRCAPSGPVCQNPRESDQPHPAPPVRNPTAGERPGIGTNREFLGHEDASMPMIDTHVPNRGPWSSTCGAESHAQSQAGR